MKEFFTAFRIFFNGVRGDSSNNPLNRQTLFFLKLDVIIRVARITSTVMIKSKFVLHSAVQVQL